MVDRIPPHNTEAEEAVLGSILLDRDAIIQIADWLTPKHFYLQTNQDIYEAMFALYERRDAIDLVTLGNELKKAKKLKSVGGAAELTRLTTVVPTAGHLKHYAKIVREHAIRRSLISLGGELTEKSFDTAVEVPALMDIAEQRVFSIAQKTTTGGFISIKSVLVESFDRLEELHKNQSGIRGVPTGFNDLDNMLSGLIPSNLVILAARPGMGKTAFALNIAQHAAVTAKKRVAFFSLEMSKEELVDRLLVAQGDIDAWRLKTGRLGEEEFSRLSHAMGVLAETSIFIDDTPGISLTELRTKARRLMMENNIELFIVDYLQLAHGFTKDNRVQEVAEISQGLKNLARELKVPVLALAQLSRAVESRGTKEPQLSDLRESGSIEQDADVVLFLYRKDDDLREQVSLKVAKHRNGALGIIDLYFRGERIKFYSVQG